MKRVYMHGNCRAEYDTDANTYTRWTPDGSAIDVQRPMTDAERESELPPVTHQQIADLTDAIDQLILDSLMGL